MGYNGKLMGRANARLSEIREKNKAEHDRRQAEVYKKLPEIQNIDLMLREQMFSLTRLMLRGKKNSTAEIDRLRDENLSLQMRRAELLTAHGYPFGWLDDIYTCKLCRDTGYTENGAVCSCLKRYYNAELTKDLSSLLRNGDESFENFDITLYSGEYSREFSCVPRDYMKKVYDLCRKFATSFPNITSGLFFCGGPGLGKTYLSACIARVVAEKGYSVCYETVVNAFQAFERQQFSRDPEEQEKAASKVRNILACDLLILDDLGTELVTPSVQSALYTFINTRENNRKHTIINTALNSSELAARYTPSICSRLDGFFQKVPFAGEDIRLVKKRRP